MIIEKVIREITKQWKEIHVWMQRIDVALDVTMANTSAQKTDIEKIKKRMARIEDKLNIKEGD